MAINLVKGQTIDLRKNAQGESFDLSTVTIGLGWDVRGGGGEAYDLDASALMLNGSGKLAGINDVVYFGNLKHASGNAWSNGDNLTGAGAGDDEQLVVKLDAMGSQFDKIVFMVNIYQGRTRGQHFGMVQNAFIRAVDKNGKEIVKYSLSGDGTYNNMCSVIFGEVYRREGSWKFRALGEALPVDSLNDVIKNYQ
ncbi:TerD family protein [Hymenobacter monticola]|uniref:TerD family protein n=1 Tax=Hymenobacter monticola TaxID=1705399 RepID=A0ABY4BEF2_9BACT|nr:TerD family protein [Hymenobacter monticola]UOE36662.1 TerD family protein [Hymenobacter monticola]